MQPRTGRSHGWCVDRRVIYVDRRPPTPTCTWTQWRPAPLVGRQLWQLTAVSRGKERLGRDGRRVHSTVLLHQRTPTHATSKSFLPLLLDRATRQTRQCRTESQHWRAVHPSGRYCVQPSPSNCTRATPTRRKMSSTRSPTLSDTYSEHATQALTWPTTMTTICEVWSSHSHLLHRLQWPTKIAM